MREHRFKFKPSTIHLTVLICLTLLSVLIMLRLPFSAIMRGVGVIFICAYGGYLVWRYGWLRSGHSILSIHRHGDDWYIVTPRETYVAQLCGDSTVTHFTSALRFRVPGERRVRSCVVFRDSLQGDEYRRLLVALKMG